MDIFPNALTDDYNNIKNKKLVASVLFGNRFHSDQTLYEYLIEFLLVFTSSKDIDLETGKMHFHDLTDDKKLSYWVEPRMGLRRFIFFDKSKKNRSIPADNVAYEKIVEILRNNIDGDEEEKIDCIEGIQDLFHGYAVVIKKRFWGAQALLPICPEFIVTECDPNLKNRKNNVNWDLDRATVDTEFSFDKRNFLARGGEVYYLHLLQGLQKAPEKKEVLEALLFDLIGKQCEQISQLANFIQTKWEQALNCDKSRLVQKLNLSFIPADAYVECEQNSIDELINYLSNVMNPINRIEILSKGMIFQIMRMMACAVANKLHQKRHKWIIDMRGSNNGIVKKIAAEAFNQFESDFITALNLVAREVYTGNDDNEMVQIVAKAKRNTFDVFKAKGKEIQCIIPSRGAYERLSLSEDVIRFLVLSLIEPEGKMTLSLFLNKLYQNYDIVIGSEEYRASITNGSELDNSLANSFVENENAFKSFLKDTGFLRELSDATSIVVNPYKRLSREE